MRRTLKKREGYYLFLLPARDILYVTGQYLLHSSKENPIYNQFLEEVFETLDEEYQPVDLSAALKLEQRKENAASRKRKMRGEMTPEEKRSMPKWCGMSIRFLLQKLFNQNMLWKRGAEASLFFIWEMLILKE